MKRYLPANFILSLPANAFAYPQLFENENDNKRRGRAVKRETQAMLTDLVDYIQIDEQNSFAIHYTNGAFFKSADQIGIAGNTSYVLEAFLDSGMKMVVSRADDNHTVLNDTEDYDTYRELSYESEVDKLNEEMEEPVMV